MSENNKNDFNITECPFCDGICTAACISQPKSLTKEQKRALSNAKKAKFREAK